MGIQLRNCAHFKHFAPNCNAVKKFEVSSLRRFQGGSYTSCEHDGLPLLPLQTEMEHVEPTAEDAKETSPRGEEEKFDPENIAKVEFRKPQPKNIVSPHSGSILAKDEPVVELSPNLKDIALNSFQEICAAAAENEMPVAKLPQTKIVDFLVACGFNHSGEHMDKVIQQLYITGDGASEEEMLTLLKKYQAPAFHFGQRLRRYASRGELSQLLQLIARGCNPNSGDGDGLTPLHYAAEFNQYDIIKSMSDMVGEDLLLNAPDKQGLVIMNVEYITSKVDILISLIGWTPLFCAAHHGNNDCVELLISLGADVNLGNKIGKTPLHAAAGQGREHICSMLLSNGASLSTVDKHNKTPLHEAAFKHHFQLYSALSNHETADLTVRDDLGNLASDYLVDFITQFTAPSDQKRQGEVAFSPSLRTLPSSKVLPPPPR